MSGEQRVFALGDVAVEVHTQEQQQQRPAYASDASSSATPSSSSPSHTRLPATAQVAFQQADYAAWNLWATINGRPLLPFRWVNPQSGKAIQEGGRSAAHMASRDSGH